MAKKDEARGQFGAWARQQRMALLGADLERGLKRVDSIWSSADKAQPEIERRTGHRMRPDYLRGIESGNQLPGPDTVEALERAYGSKAPPVRPEPQSGGGSDSDIAAAIREQTAAINALVAQLAQFSDRVTRAEELRSGRVDGVVDVLRVMDQKLDDLAGRTRTASGPGRPPAPSKSAP